MGAQNRLAIAHRRLFAQERLKPLVFENALDGAHAIGPLGVIGAHVMGER